MTIFQTRAAATSTGTPDIEEKYKQVMMTNAQLDNDRQMLTYEVDLLKDRLADSEEHVIQIEQLLAHTSRVRLAAGPVYASQRLC